MAIEAPVSKFRKTNIKIYIVVCLIVAAWFGYDGYFGKVFIEKHTNADGTVDSTLAFNRKSPPFFVGAAVLLAGYLAMLGKRKIVAEEKQLIIEGKKQISYESIEKIDKTEFETKGYFVIGYKDETGKEVSCRMSEKKYDNLSAILDKLVAEIS